MSYQNNTIEVVEKAEVIRNQIRLAKEMGVSRKSIILTTTAEHTLNVRYVAFMFDTETYDLHGHGHKFIAYVTDMKTAYAAAKPGAVNQSGFIVDHEDFTRFILNSTNS